MVSSWTTANASTSPGAPPLFADQSRRLGRDIAADAIVEGAGHDAPVRKLERVRVDHRDVSDPHALARLVRRLRPDVDVKVLELGDLLALLALSRWIGLRPITPVTGPPRVKMTTRWATSTSGSQPPTWPKRR